jgi:hypothetical protein
MTRTTVIIIFLCFADLVLIGKHFMGQPTLADQRLADEQWRAVAIAPLEEDRFLVSVRYSKGDIRTYMLTVTDPAQKDALLKAAGAMKKGRSLNGKARFGRAGLQNDSDMQFDFRDAPEANPKETSP